MTERDALLRAVCTDPADDLPRLVYADWLDEHGQPERAEFIRVQVELATLPPCRHASLGTEPAANREGSCRRCGLVERERTLWSGAVGEAVTRSLGFTHLDMAGGTFLDDLPAVAHTPIPVHRHLYVVRRGFVVEARCRLEALVGGPCVACSGDGRFHPDPSRTDHALACPACEGDGRAPGVAGRLFNGHPVERVVCEETLLENRHEWEPRLPEGWTIFAFGDSARPAATLEEAFVGVRGVYATRQLALDRLSAALVGYGRGLAGLPRRGPNGGIRGGDGGRTGSPADDRVES